MSKSVVEFIFFFKWGLRRPPETNILTVIFPAPLLVYLFPDKKAKTSKPLTVI